MRITTLLAASALALMATDGAIASGTPTTPPEPEPTPSEEGGASESRITPSHPIEEDGGPTGDGGDVQPTPGDDDDDGDETPAEGDEVPEAPENEGDDRDPNTGNVTPEPGAFG